MLIYALNFTFGVVLFSLKNSLEITPLEWGILLVLMLSIIPILAFKKRAKMILLNLLSFFLGFIWMGVFSAQTINNQVDNIYLNKTIIIEGNIVQLPTQTDKKTNFVFQAKKPFQATLKLSWYGEERQPIESGDLWQLQVKLKRNNGYQNWAGFDYEKWLFYQQIAATGYVKSSAKNQLIAAQQDFSVDKLRQNIRQSLSTFIKNLEFGGVINALIIGDRSLITKPHWQLFKSTNTTHLTVISGLHIGLISGFIFLLVSFVWRRSSRCCLLIPAPIMGAYFGMIGALLYALLAGFSIPTNRAFIMASVVFISIILKRNTNIWHLYGLALLLVLIKNPLSVLSIGFWLSFYVVAVIIYAAQQHQNKSWLYRLIYIQLLITIATTPLVAWFFSQGSLFSAVANLVAIPLFSFIITPLALLAALLFFINLPALAIFGFKIANYALIGLGYLLNELQSLHFNQWYYNQTSAAELLLLLVATLIVIAPKALGLRKFSVLILGVILFFPATKIPPKTALITVLDVGQGLSIIVQTTNHNLLFDTGSGFASGFNLGQSVINPVLHFKKVNYLDKIIISHGDNDHIGGLSGVLKEFQSKQILTSVPKKIKQATTKCQSGQTWEWDGVLFTILNPELNSNLVGNNNSCVIKISTPKYSILLTADIERKAEKRLVKTYQNRLQSDIMIVPHHGSKTSSTPAFIKAVDAQTVIISSGFKNRFKHPAQAVVNRYQDNNINIINSACAGQIEIKLADKITLSQYRKEHGYYYTRQCKLQKSE